MRCPAWQTVSAERWRDLISDAPPVDADFAGDVELAREDFGPPSSAWPS
jgi:hypothetical protein